MNTRTTLVLVVLALILGVGVWLVSYQETKTAEKKAAEQTGPKNLFDPKPAEIVQIRVEIAGKPARLLVKRDDKWWLTEPIEAPARQWTVDDDARIVRDLKYVEKYEPGSADFPGDDITGLKEPQVVITIKDKDGAEHKILVGNLRPLSEQTYVKKDNDPAVYVVTENLVKTFIKKLDEYRDRRVVNFIVADAVRLKAEGARNYEAVKSDGKWIFEKPVRARADKDKIEDVLRTFSGIYAEEFVADNPKNLRIYGLDEPQLKLTVVTEKEKKQEPQATQPASKPAESQPAKKVERTTITLLVGSKVRNRYFAKRADQPWVFQINETTFKNLSATLDDLRDKRVVELDADKAAKVEITAGEEHAVVEKTGHKWQISNAVKGDAETSAVEDLVKAIADLKAAAFEDEPKPQLVNYGFASPKVQLRVFCEGQVKPVEILVGAETPSGEMTFVKNVAENFIAVVKKEDADALLIKPVNLLERTVMKFDRSQVKRLEVVQQGRRVVLTKSQEGQWQLIEPVTADAGSEAVRAILADLCWLRARKVVARDDESAYGLTQPDAEVTVTVVEEIPASQPSSQPATQPASTSQQAAASAPASAAASAPATTSAPASMPTTAPATRTVEKKFRLLVSKRAEKVYAKRPDRPWIYEIDPIIRTHMLAELRDRFVIKFDPQDAVAIKVPTPKQGQVLEFVKRGKTWTYLGDRFFQVNQQRVKDWLNDLKNLKVQKFIAYEAEDIADYGLDQPQVQAEVTLKDGRVLKLLIAKPTSTGRYAAAISGSKAVFELQASQVRRIKKTLEYFKKK